MPHVTHTMRIIIINIITIITINVRLDTSQYLIGHPSSISDGDCRSTLLNTTPNQLNKRDYLGDHARLQEPRVQRDAVDYLVPFAPPSLFPLLVGVAHYRARIFNVRVTVLLPVPPAPLPREYRCPIKTHRLTCTHT